MVGQTVFQVGKWVLGATIGTGSYGVVREAFHAETGAKAAVKVMDSSKLKTAQEKRSVLREIEIHARLDHPNVTKILEVLYSPEQVFVIMELMDGGDLFQYVISRGKLTENQARTFFTQICSALEYCHSVGVAHRDIKLENFLVDRSGKSVKLTDFGLSCQYTSDPLMTFCGSTFYVAPEVAMAMPYAGPSADMWSLGITLFAMLTGRLPFVDDRGRLVLDKALKGIERFPRDMSLEAANVINMLVQPFPDNRANFTELFSQSWMGPRTKALSPTQTLTLTPPSPSTSSSSLPSSPSVSSSEKKKRNRSKTSESGPRRRTVSDSSESKKKIAGRSASGKEAGSIRTDTKDEDVPTTKSTPELELELRKKSEKDFENGQEPQDKKPRTKKFGGFVTQDDSNIRRRSNTFNSVTVQKVLSPRSLSGNLITIQQLPSVVPVETSGSGSDSPPMSPSPPDSSPPSTPNGTRKKKKTFGEWLLGKLKPKKHAIEAS